MARNKGVPSHVVEREYVQCLYLREISEKSDSFVFKGGTALRLIHGLDRYSEDLDFNHPDRREEIIDTAESCTKNVRRYGIQTELRDLRWGTTGLSYSLSFQDPLYKQDSLSSKGKIRVDISTREEDYESEFALIKVEYPDINDFWVKTLTLEELAAEKIRALRTRGKPRDLFDVWYLYEHGVVPEKKLIEKKMSIYSKEDTADIDETLTKIKDNWESDLSVLLRQIPPLERIIEDLNDFLSR